MSLWVIPQRIKMPTNCKNIWTAFLIISIFLNDISQQARGGGEQGWRSGEGTRLPPMWPGFKSWR